MARSYSLAQPRRSRRLGWRVRAGFVAAAVVLIAPAAFVHHDAPAAHHQVVHVRAHVPVSYVGTGHAHGKATAAPKLTKLPRLRLHVPYALRPHFRRLFWRRRFYFRRNGR